MNPEKIVIKYRSKSELSEVMQSLHHFVENKALFADHDPHKKLTKEVAKSLFRRLAAIMIKPQQEKLMLNPVEYRCLIAVLLETPVNTTMNEWCAIIDPLLD